MGQIIEYNSVNDKLIVPDDPIIPVIPGDGIGPDLWNATRAVVEAAVAKAYGGKRAIEWFEIMAGESAFKQVETYLPAESLDAIRKYRVAIKGPLTTPVGKGFRSVNVQLRFDLDLYACVRPVSHMAGVPSPVLAPDKVDMVIFRENTEDVYAGIEWEEGSAEAAEVISLVKKLAGKTIRPDSGIGIKPISKTGTMSDFGGVHRYNVTGLFHDIWGFPTENPEQVNRLVHHLVDKIENRAHLLARWKEYYLDDAEHIIISYGSTARSARHLVESRRSKGDRIGLLELQTLWPFPAQLVREKTAKARNVFVAEMNMLSDPNVRGILINIFGGILRCDIVAQGVANAARKVDLAPMGVAAVAVCALCAAMLNWLSPSP